MARPTKDPENRLTHGVRFRVTLAERVTLEARAVAMGLTPSEYCRQMTLARPPKPSRKRAVADEKLLLEVNRIGVNLNQLAKAANAGRTLESSISVTLAEVRQIMADLSDMLGDGGGA